MSRQFPIAVACCLWLTALVHAGEQSARISVIRVYEGMADFLDALTRSPTADRQALWREKVRNPYWRQCAEGGEYIDFAPSLATPPEDPESLRIAIVALRASSIETAVRSAMARSASLLPGPATTVCILAGHSGQPHLRDMHGISGFTAGAGKIWLTILPDGDWKDWLIYAIAHEHHHSTWTSRHRQQDPIKDMADYLVFEGRADSFARLVDPQHRAPWTAAMTSRQERAAWRTIRRHLGTTSAPLLQGLMFGGTENVPRWGGYTIGFNIVQQFLQEHHGLDVNQWTAMPAGDLLRQSPYTTLSAP